ADSGEKIRLSDAPFLERITQSDNDRFLADEAGEILRAPFAREDLIRHLRWQWSTKGSGEAAALGRIPYRCSLPGLTRFDNGRCTGPEPFVGHCEGPHATSEDRGSQRRGATSLTPSREHEFPSCERGTSPLFEIRAAVVPRWRRFW